MLTDFEKKMNIFSQNRFEGIVLDHRRDPGAKRSGGMKAKWLLSSVQKENRTSGGELLLETYRRFVDMAFVYASGSSQKQYPQGCSFIFREDYSLEVFR